MITRSTTLRKGYYRDIKFTLTKGGNTALPINITYSTPPTGIGVSVVPQAIPQNKNSFVMRISGFDNIVAGEYVLTVSGSPLPLEDFELTLTVPPVNTNIAGSIPIVATPNTASIEVRDADGILSYSGTGTLTVANAQGGNYTYAVEAPGYTTATGGFTVNGSAYSTTVSLVASGTTTVPPTAKITVNSSSPNSRFDLYKLPNLTTPVAQVMEGSKLVLNGAENGEYRVIVQHPSHNPSEQNITLSGSDVEITLTLTTEPTTTAPPEGSGRLIMSSNPLDATKKIFRAGDNTLFTQSNTSISLPIPNGSYYYTVSAAGYVGRSGEFVVASNQIPLYIDLPLSREVVPSSYVSSQNNNGRYRLGDSGYFSESWQAPPHLRMGVNWETENLYWKVVKDQQNSLLKMYVSPGNNYLDVEFTTSGVGGASMLILYYKYSSKLPPEGIS